MLFQIDYSVFKSNRRDALTAFGTFTQEQLESLLDDHGVELIGRWHCLGEGTGTMIVATVSTIIVPIPSPNQCKRPISSPT